MNEHRLYYGDCLEILPDLPKVACIFADPPDNLGLKYDGYDDNKANDEYLLWLRKCLDLFVQKADIVWLSFNAKYFTWVSEMTNTLLCDYDFVNLEAKMCVQTYTFGQHNQHDLGNNYRPLLRLKRKSALLYPDQIRVKSQRQLSGDKRADPRGRVPGDVFDIPRVTGNSKQRRKWCPTQLNEKLVERCIKLTTLPGQRVIDPFGGTGTTLRVCKAANRPCTLIEYSLPYCREIGKEHALDVQMGVIK